MANSRRNARRIIKVNPAAPAVTYQTNEQIQLHPESSRHASWNRYLCHNLHSKDGGCKFVHPRCFAAFIGPYTVNIEQIAFGMSAAS